MKHNWKSSFHELTRVGERIDDVSMAACFQFIVVKPLVREAQDGVVRAIVLGQYDVPIVQVE